MPKYKNNLKLAISENQKLPCEVPGCNRLRVGLYKACEKHFRNVIAHGWSQGRALRPKDIAVERHEIEELLTENPDHPGLRAAAEFLEGWVVDAAEGKKGTPGLSKICKLMYAGVRGKSILQQVLATWLYAHRRPDRVPEGKPLQYALCFAMLKLAPPDYYPNFKGQKRARPISNKLKAEVGKHIIANLSLLSWNVFKHFEKKELAERARKANQLQPFKMGDEETTTSTTKQFN